MLGEEKGGGSFKLEPRRRFAGNLNFRERIAAVISNELIGTSNEVTKSDSDFVFTRLAGDEWIPWRVNKSPDSAGLYCTNTFRTRPMRLWNLFPSICFSFFSLFPRNIDFLGTRKGFEYFFRESNSGEKNREEKRKKNRQFLWIGKRYHTRWTKHFGKHLPNTFLGRIERHAFLPDTFHYRSME